MNPSPHSAVLAAIAALLGQAAAAAPAAACSGKMSGSVEATFTCEASVTTTADGTAVFVLNGTTAIDGVPSYTPGAFEVPGVLAVKTYTLATLGMGKASVAAESGTLYTAAKTSSERGEVEITFTSVRERSDAPGTYDVRGRYHARLVPAGSGKTGEVRIDVTF
jgi:hypothetical protein